MSDKARLAAFNAVKRINNGAFSNLISVGSDIEGLDRAFAESIAMGTLERKITLEYVLADVVRESTKNDIKLLIMTGLYQILYMDRVPDSAACDETVTIAKTIFGSKAAGFVNAVLRNICRNKDDIYKKIENASGYIKYSVNEELFELIKNQYPDCCNEIFEAFFGKLPLFLRVNTLKSNANDVAMTVDGKALSDTTVICNNSSVGLSLIEEGKFYVQGLASQEAVRWLDTKSGMTVVDVCACPGGKTLGAAIDMKNDGIVYSFDLHANKLPLIEKSAKILGIDIIKTEKHDARFVRDQLIGIADRVICDVPCSGTGVMGSKPEIKYKSPSDFIGLYATQKAIVKAASKYLKIGGVMIYSTCSINKLENETVVAEFTAENPNFKLIEDKTALPFSDEKEGVYMAKIIREY
jgi:16S rRNA (cytosine967-C5)-methyltransferase